MKKSNPFILLLISFVAYSVFVSGQNYNVVQTLNDHAGGITVMTTDPAKKMLIAGDNKGNLYFYDLATTALIRKVDANAAPVSQLRFNSNSDLLISATNDGEIKIFDFKKNKIIQSIYSPEYSGIRFVLFSIADGFIYFNSKNKLYKT